MQIYNSYKITNEAQQREILEILIKHDQAHPSRHTWGRTVESMLIEWEMHNYFYFATFHERVAHTDFDKDSEGWKRIDYLTYAILEVWNDYVKH